MRGRLLAALMMSVCVVDAASAQTSAGDSVLMRRPIRGTGSGGTPTATPTPSPTPTPGTTLSPTPGDPTTGGWTTTTTPPTTPPVGPYEWAVAWWQVGTWEGAGSCGQPTVMTRAVSCQAFIEYGPSTEVREVDDSMCIAQTGKPRPSDTYTGDGANCLYHLESGEWGPWSSTCSYSASRKRELLCKTESGLTVDMHYCEGPFGPTGYYQDVSWQAQTEYGQQDSGCQYQWTQHNAGFASGSCNPDTGKKTVYDTSYWTCDRLDEKGNYTGGADPARCPGTQPARQDREEACQIDCSGVGGPNSAYPGGWRDGYGGAPSEGTSSWMIGQTYYHKEYKGDGDWDGASGTATPEEVDQYIAARCEQMMQDLDYYRQNGYGSISPKLCCIGVKSVGPFAQNGRQSTMVVINTYGAGESTGGSCFDTYNDQFPKVFPLEDPHYWEKQGGMNTSCVRFENKR